MGMSTKLEFDVIANDKASSKLSRIASAFQKFGTIGRNVGNQAAGGIGRVGGAIAGAAKLGVAGVAVLGAGAIAAMPKLFSLAGGLELMGKKAATVFGGELGKVQDWADRSAHAMGVTTREAVGLASGFADLLIPMGFTRKQAADMATDTVGLSGALAEWSGGALKAAEVSDILSAAFLGERDGLQALGISISQAEVDAELLARGQDKLTGKALQQAEALATQRLIMAKSTDAQAAFAKGGDSLSRKMAQSTAKLKEMGQELLVRATPAMSSMMDVISEHVMPKLQEFADWLGGPGLHVMTGWALQSGSAFLGFADSMLGGIQSMLGGLGKYARVALIAAAASVALFSPNLAANMLQQADAVGTWATEAAEGIGNARGKLQDWKATLDKTNTTVQLKANIADLDTKLARARKELKDPNLTKTRRAQLQAEIAQLTRAKDAAVRKLNDPALTKKRVAELQANKRDLDSKISTAKRQLADRRLTATKRAKLEAYIGQLLRAKAQAQASINSLTGKTVNVRLNTYRTMIETTIRNDVGVRAPGRARGGPVSKGQPYVVGEERAELFVPKEDGMIIPEVPPNGSGRAYGGRGGGRATFALSFDDSETSRFIVRMLRKGLISGGVQGDVQMLIGGRPA